MKIFLLNFVIHNFYLASQIIINLSQAKQLFLKSQLLHKNISKGKENLYNIINQLGYIQIDTISVVERSHHHILFSRQNSYNRKHLDELVKEKKVFEYWSHAAAYLPIDEYRFTLPRKEDYKKHYRDWSKKNKKLLSFVTDRIKAEGSLKSKDFEHRKISGTGWWDWKPAKNALEYLFHSGELFVIRREGFQKVYELTERVIDSNVNTNFPTNDELTENLIMNTVRATGLASEKEIFYQRKYDKKIFVKVCSELIEENKISELKVKSLDEKYFTFPSNLEMLSKPSALKSVHVLSPFDNAVIQRQRLKKLFGFDYVIECYLPAHKRKFGYFSLPVLFGDKFVMRMDCKADSSLKKFIVKNIFYEKSFKANNKSMIKFESKLKKLSEFSGCDVVEHFISGNSTDIKSK